MRPIAVLLVVLVAIGALISALLFMGQQTPTAIETGPNTTDGQTTPANQDPANLTPNGGREHPDLAEQANSNREDIAQPNSAGHFDNRLEGSVINRSGDPVAGAKVTLDFQNSELLFELEQEDRTPGREAVTNASGEFSLENVEPSDFYTLYVTHDDFCPTKSTGVQVALEGPTTEPPIVMQSGAALSGYVNDTGGAPIAGAELILAVTMFSTVAGPLNQVVKSDANGFYSFGHVAKGMKTLRANADGFGNQMHGGMTFNGRDPVDKDIELSIAAIIGGIVTDSESGRPIEGASLLALNYSNSNRSSQDMTKSGKDGRFTLDSLNVGDYTLMINAFGYDTDRVLRVQTGELNLAIQLNGKAEVRGTVIARDTGETVAEGTLQLRAVHKGTELTSAIDVTGSFTDGEFTLHNVPEGEYVIEASALPLGYSPTYSPTFVVADGQDVTGVTIRIKRGATIRGRVVDVSGTAVAGALVSTHDNNYTASDEEFFQLFGSSFPNNATSQKVRTGKDGSFEFKAMRPDVYQVNVVSTGYVRFIQRSIQLDDLEQRDLGDLQLSLGGTVKGTLYDAGGVPLPGGQVNLQLSDQEAYPERYKAKSDAAGAYRIQNIRQGNYIISATSSTVGGDNPFIDIANRKNTESTIAVNEGRTLNHDIHLTGQPDISAPIGNDPRQR